MSVRAVEEEIKQLYPKEEKNEGASDMEVKNVSNFVGVAVPSANSFINTNPLMPTTGISEPTQPSTFNEKTTVPPIVDINKVASPSLLSDASKFINYGELDDDDDDSEPMQFNNPVAPVDLNSIRNNAVDINAPKEETKMPSADLDSLLNLQNLGAGPAVGNIPGTSSFLSPAEEIVKTDSTKIIPTEKTADYFKMPDYIPEMATTNMVVPEMPTKKEYNVDSAMKKLRDTISELKLNGISIQADEMNFDNSYQIIIKVDK